MLKISNRIVVVHRTPVFSGHDSLSGLPTLYRTMRPSSVAILTDTNTRNHCLPVLLEKAPFLSDAFLIESVAGEEAKSLENAARIWAELQQAGTDRSGLLLNLGGGTISDLGGFAAAGYKRGIRYINIPTTLIGLADAAIGGKTGVNFGGIKNQVGFFYAPAAVCLFPGFLKTLPGDHLRSGLAEIVKSALTGDAKLWRSMASTGAAEILGRPPGDPLWQRLIRSSATFKNRIVMQDFQEKGVRQVLNFGHTIGHALEAFSLHGFGYQVLHGDAVAAGMICTAYLSGVRAALPGQELTRVTEFLDRGFPHLPLEAQHIDHILELMAHDKKNRNGMFRFVLLSLPGKPLVNVVCTPDEVRKALHYYIGLNELRRS